MYSKSIIIVLFASFLLSCTRSNFYEHQLLSSLPVNGNTQQIDVFYEGESSPPKDYIEYYNLRLVKKGHFNDEQMVSFLKQEALKKGLDGLMDPKKWDETEESATFFDVLATITDPDDIDYTSTVNYSIIEAKGIRYIENIDLTHSLKAGKVYDMTTNAYMGEIRYLPNGLISETIAENDLSQMLMDTYFKFSEDHLLYEQEGWQTLHRLDGRIDVRRKYRMNDWILARVRVKYNGNKPEQIRSIRVTENPKKTPIISRIVYQYDAQNRPISRKVSGAYQLTETITYENNKIKSAQISHFGKTYRVDYSFYKQSDLQNLISKVEDISTEN
ncbi:MAG: hypothetical protein HEP71_03945 [Roseivirga sp.]|nr:hypothetical protein [Roseivirga sp.]